MKMLISGVLRGGSQIAFLVMAGFALCASRATAQTTITFKFIGSPFDVAYCNSEPQLHGIFTCVGGSITALATFNVPSFSSSGGFSPESFTASALGLTITSTNFYNSFFGYSNGVLTGQFQLNGGGFSVIESYFGEGDAAINGNTGTIGISRSNGVWTLVSAQTGTAPPLQITTTYVPSAASGLSYGPATITATGGSGRGYTWCVQSGSGCVQSGSPLALGFALSSEGSCGNTCTDVTLTSTGIPAALAGSYPFTVQVTDSAGNLATQQFTLVVTSCPFAISVKPSGADGQPTMQASFTAPGYANLMAAANACGFTSFDWVQQVTHAGPTPVYQATSTGGKGPILQAPFNDPPQNGYYNVPGSHWPPFLNANPFFYNPAYVDNSHCTGKLTNGSCALPITQGNTLNFFDAPGDPCEIGGAAYLAAWPQCGNSTFQGFTTQLVGVCGSVPAPFVPSPLCTASSEPSAPLFEWTWQTNWDGCPPMSPTNPNCGVLLGGIYEVQTISSSLPGPGTGGVTVTSINGVQLPTPVSPSQATTTASGLAYSRVSQTFDGTVIVTNIGSSPITGPLQILFMGIPANVTLVNATGNLSGTPYITVPVSAGGQITWTLEDVTFANGETASGTFVVDALPTNGFYIVDAWNVAFRGLPAGYPTASSGTYNSSSCSAEGCVYICSDPSDVSCSANTGYYETTPVQEALDAGASTAPIGSGMGLTTGMALLANGLFPPTAGKTIPLIVTTPSVQESYISAYDFNTGSYADVGNLLTGSIVQTLTPTVPGAGLAPGQSLTVSVQFKNPSNATIHFTPAIYSGSIN